MRLPTPYRDEASVAAHRLSALAGALDWGAVEEAAAPWIAAARAHPPPPWALERLLHEYPIDSAEGLALLRLAEALLRVSDAPTAIALTADQLARADFAGGGDSALARLGAAAAALSRKLLPAADAQPQGLAARLGARGVVAAALRAMQLLARQFVLGEDIAGALREAAAARRRSPPLRFSYDMLGEGARTGAQAERYLARYAAAVEAIAAEAALGEGTPERADGLSIKLSALHPRYEFAQRERVLRELVPRLWPLCARASRAQINLTIDAEESPRLELSLEVFDALAARVAREQPQWRGFGLALQAYQTRALELTEEVIGIARARRLRLMCRLVKGAYWDTEIKRAQELGLPHYPVFTHRQHTDASYLACARALLAAPDAVHPQFATHNAATLAAVVQLAGGRAFELQRLHGMGEGIHREAMAALPGLALRVYAPVGPHKDLLAYLVRRLLENGANSSFVNQLADPRTPPAALLASPLRLARESALPLPPLLYGPAPARRNSLGLDLAVESMAAPLLAAHARGGPSPTASIEPTRIGEALACAQAAWPGWRQTPVAARAASMRRVADALQDALPRFAALLVREAFKTWADAVAEVREAIDLLRYYADEAERVMRPLALPGPTGETNLLRLVPRGAWVCISPWNFPLAIFTGQVAAALVTGNTALAKPAEQTPAVAQALVALLHEAGVPRGALQLLPGPGETVGAALVGAEGVAGVVFTGSTEVAKTIARALAAKAGPIVPLIAETGGVNAMLVDASALPEQVVDAVIDSAFRSAGQRCSALRLLCVHEAIADELLAMLRGAAAELAPGDPALLATDLGPLIDRAAFDAVAQALRGLGAEAALAAAQSARRLMPPCIVEVDAIERATREIFGPVLQVARWRGDPARVIERIDALGWGLTLGLQTRIDSRALALAEASRAGNVYINRNMVGAVVGVQPFGGQGLSGTGPKAGGPHYLPRFCAEQTVTVNTAAAGGNPALLAQPGEEGAGS